jgi:hydrogenase maturation protein HypF
MKTLKYENQSKIITTFWKANHSLGNIINCNNTNFFKKLQPNQIILALGVESAGNFSIYFSGKIFFSENFNDLLNEKNYKNFQKSVLNFFKKNKIKPTIILTDLHPLYKTTLLGEKLAKKFKTKHIKIQHHIAHIFSAIGEKILINNVQKLQATSYKLQANFFGIACDGTGYGLDGKIWGGEVFQAQNVKIKIQNDNAKRKTMKNSKFQIQRIGHLENQIMIGGDLAVKEPARMLISILTKFSIDSTNLPQIFNFQFSNNSQNSKFKIKTKKQFIYQFVKKYYTKNQFELLYNQLRQNFNCQETSSAGRILDAVSILLGFCKNERNYKHEPIDLLEKNSTIPYYDLKPKIFGYKLQTTNYKLLNTTFLFEYLIKNLHRDKKRLAATAQLYIAQGLYQIIFNFQFSTFKQIQNSKFQIQNKLPIFFGGGLANNKIISNYLKSKNVYINKKFPRGDAGISIGQIMWTNA